jgi:hypothetical protein
MEQVMSYAKTCLTITLAAGLVVWAAGCYDSSTPTAPAGKSGDEHGHEGHGHEHAHVHGPHDGHLIELGYKDYHAEWTHDESGKVTVYILDAEAKMDVPIAATDISIDTVVAGKTNTFKLAAVDPTEGEMPKAAKFEIVDQQLLGVLESLSKEVTATLKLEIDGMPISVNIEHDDHGHKH